jgi:hypothetical protein
MCVCLIITYAKSIIHTCLYEHIYIFTHTSTLMDDDDAEVVVVGDEPKIMDAAIATLQEFREKRRERSRSRSRSRERAKERKDDKAELSTVLRIHIRIHMKKNAHVSQYVDIMFRCICTVLMLIMV